MKKITAIVALTFMLSVTFIQKNYAQQDEWVHGHSKGIYSVGLGGTQGIAVYNGFSTTGDIGLSVNVSGEYKVWKFIGVGWQTGLDVLWAYGYGYGYYGYGYAGTGGTAFIGIPIMAKCNVHIMDAAKVKIANKLDVYAGLTVGGGPLIPTYTGGAVAGIVHVGPQAGVHYWFNDNIAIFGEVGWGATFVNGGVTF
jgi:hypothetical protein